MELKVLLRGGGGSDIRVCSVGVPDPELPSHLTVSSGRCGLEVGKKEFILGLMFRTQKVPTINPLFVGPEKQKLRMED